MQQIVNFILKNSNRLLFLLLLVTSLSLTIQSHSYHKSKIISSANFFTGGIYERINNVDEYYKNWKFPNPVMWAGGNLLDVVEVPRLFEIYKVD